MAKYRIELIVEESNIKSVEAKLKKHFSSEAVATAKKINLALSRADRLAEADGMVQDAKSEVESLRDEVQEWYDNLPDNFQNGDKGNTLQECIDTLDNLSSDMDNLDFSSVSFPGMYD